MSDAREATGGFGQFGEQYRERWAALHPDSGKVSEPALTAPDAPADKGAVVIPPASPDASAETIANARAAARRAASTAPFGRRRIPPS